LRPGARRRRAMRMTYRVGLLTSAFCVLDVGRGHRRRSSAAMS
jgi:hypothetical protein